MKISDEPLLKDFFYSLSDNSLYRRFISLRKDMPHETLAGVRDHRLYQRNGHPGPPVREAGRKRKSWRVGQYGNNENTHTAEVALAVRDDYQNQGIGTELLSYLTYLAKREGLLGFTAEVLVENQPMLHLFEKMGFDIQKRSEQGCTN